MVQEACEIIGQAVANVVLLICPDCIILGGGLVEAMPDLLVKEVQKVAKRNVFDCYRDQFRSPRGKAGG
ncbi:MAG: ROK family protein [Pirellulaceae bacterium]